MCFWSRKLLTDWRQRYNTKIYSWSEKAHWLQSIKYIQLGQQRFGFEIPKNVLFIFTKTEKKVIVGSTSFKLDTFREKQNVVYRGRSMCHILFESNKNKEIFLSYKNKGRGWQRFLHAPTADAELMYYTCLMDGGNEAHYSTYPIRSKWASFYLFRTYRPKKGKRFAISDRYLRLHWVASSLIPSMIWLLSNLIIWTGATSVSAPAYYIIGPWILRIQKCNWIF